MLEGHSFHHARIMFVPKRQLRHSVFKNDDIKFGINMLENHVEVTDDV